MFRFAMAALVGMSTLSAVAQMTPVGLWKTISDKDGLVTSEVRIVENAGVLSGKVERILHPDAKPDDKCNLCKDERKDQLQLGMEIIRAAKKAESKDVWEDGNILDPENGSVYRLKMTPVDGGKKLEIRGYIGAPIFGRTQTWFRVQ
jgi:uncharacterized protein (DUF2147 family)